LFWPNHADFGTLKATLNNPVFSMSKACNVCFSVATSLHQRELIAAVAQRTVVWQQQTAELLL